MARKKKPTGDMKPNHALNVEQTRDETGAQAIARKVLDPGMRHGLAASAFAGKSLGNLEGPGLGDYIDHVLKAADKGEAGELALASRTLTAQAITLDAMFTELARRAAMNLGEYLDASERFARLAMKAQSNSRATFEALAKLHQPREQTVRHVHVNEGGQAVIADQFHNHRGAAENAESVEQSDATGAAGSGSPLLGKDPQGDEVPIASRERAKAVQDARRDKFRRA
jgi:hypothetical protein